MNQVGVPDCWKSLIESLVPDILHLLVSTWDSMPAPVSDAREDPTTEEFCRCLRKNRAACDLPFQIHTQLVELDPSLGEGQGRMDIVFVPLVPREDVYFCLECKRLNVLSDERVRPYTSEYITHGMLRFIKRQYAPQMRHGGMLGYVLDGDVEQAVKNVCKLIQSRYEELKMPPPGNATQSSIFPQDARLMETTHNRGSNSEDFLIHHFFA
jgi:hypothetical protein